MKDGHQKGGFFHVLFLRGRPDLVASIRRPPRRSAGKKLPRRQRATPDFYRYPICKELSYKQVIDLWNQGNKKDPPKPDHQSVTAPVETPQVSASTTQMVLPQMQRTVGQGQAGYGNANMITNLEGRLQRELNAAMLQQARSHVGGADGLAGVSDLMNYGGSQAGLQRHMVLVPYQEELHNQLMLHNSALNQPRGGISMGQHEDIRQASNLLSQQRESEQQKMLLQQQLAAAAAAGKGPGDLRKSGAGSFFHDQR